MLLSKCRAAVIGFSAALIFGHPAHADPVAQEYLGLTVVGNLEIAAGKSLKSDGAVILVHDTLAHHSDETIVQLQNSLKTKGLNTLAITLSLGIHQRKAAFDCANEHDHRHGDASDEIVAWVEWLQAKSAARVTLFGTGRGATQVALSAAERQDLTVKHLILARPVDLSPAALSAGFQQWSGQALAPLLEQARKRADDGEGDSLLNVPVFLTCQASRTTAAAFVDYYGGDNRQDLVNLLPELKQPTLLILAGNDALTKDFEKRLSTLQPAGRFAQQRLSAVNAGIPDTLPDVRTDQLASAIAAFVNAD
jgi:hypothetical protein